MDDAILYMSDELKLTAFERNWARLQTSTTHLDLDALRLCVRLLPQSSEHREKLRDLLLQHLVNQRDEPEYVYQLAEACTLDLLFAGQFFHTVLSNAGNVPDGSDATGQGDDHIGHIEQGHEHAIPRDEWIASYLMFLKYSFWLSPSSFYVLQPGISSTLLLFVDSSAEVVSDAALDALSALLSLRRSALHKPVRAVNPRLELPWLQLDLTNQLVFRGPVVDQSVWAVFKTLSPAHFETKSSKLFKVWFQWISQAVTDGLDPDGIYEDLYWERVRTGLLNGFADQRKYCLGIIRASLLAARRDINTRSMCLEVDKKDVYIQAYDRYFVLYETIVLDRYANQIEASLSELSALFGSKSVVTASMATALLSSGLDPLVQEGIRKIVGNWYFGFISGSQSPLSKDSASLAEHTDFLAHAFLPWATQGGLFVSTLKTARTDTECVHGAALVKLVARFAASEFSDQTYREELLVLVLKFVLSTEGKLFQMSALYLLEGLINGYDQAAQNGGSTRLSLQTIETLLRVSRTPGLPEVASDLYKVYCKRLCEFAVTDLNLDSIPGYPALAARIEELGSVHTATEPQPAVASTTSSITSLSAFLQTLQDSKHASIQGAAYATVCDQLVAFLGSVDLSAVNSEDLHAALDAMWEEADRREFNRSVAVHLPALLFHPTCIRICLTEHVQTPSDVSRTDLQALLTKAATTLQQLSEGRSYILATFAISLRKAALAHSSILDVLPYEDIIVRFFNHPPAAKVEFLFEVAAAEKLQRYIPHRSYEFYYGQREWHAYAAWVDLLNRFPESQNHVAKRIFDRLLEPWAGQKGSVPVISKWKDVLQLQAMLVLTEHCILGTDVDVYLDKFMHALTVEQWPRYRFVLEWIITRIYFYFPRKTDRVLKDLAHLDENSPIHIASLMKLAVLIAPYLQSEDFAMDLIVQLIPFSASQKVHIRHEAHLSFPVIFELAEKKGWTRITSNPGFSILNTHIRQTEKFKTPAWSIRTLRIDAVADFTLTGIFQGQYLYIESPEQERVAHEDFAALSEADHNCILPPQQRILTGEPRTQTEIPINPKPAAYVLDEDGVKSNFYQTKSGFDFNSLLPPAGAPHLQAKQPASVILIASLIDNPTNLGGLSRISESFGLETLFINDIKKTAHKDFKATSVTSEKHLPIKELREPDVPAFITRMKTKGYEVVGIEQTDRSGMLGDEIAEGAKDVGTLPRRCVLVLGAEKSGITPEVLSVVDRCVEIRTVGVTRSLNVQTAGGIAVYEWWREWNGKI